MKDSRKTYYSLLQETRTSRKKESRANRYLEFVRETNPQLWRRYQWEQHRKQYGNASKRRDPVSWGFSINSK